MKHRAGKNRDYRYFITRLNYLMLQTYHLLLKSYILFLNKIGIPLQRNNQPLLVNSLRQITGFIAHCQQLPPRSIPSFKQPVDVSIIIPVFNQWHYTQACINSIIEVCDEQISYELILADDCSTDETINAQQHFPGLKVARTPKNVGFLRNCNHAAQQSQGRYLMLLNNDTIVLPNWLNSLVHVMEQESSCAIVGSKLLNPNSTIQEAGAQVFADGRVVQWGKKHHRRSSSFNTLVNAHYISGCSLLIRASFWQRVGGFDERYQHAYFEDPDLAMTARKERMCVIYQPESEVIHFKHRTYFKKQRINHLNTNRMLFLQKWRKELNAELL